MRSVLSTFPPIYWYSESFDFTTSAASHFARSLLEPEALLGPTALVIASALTTEFSASLTLTPQQLLHGLASKLKTCPRW